MFQRLKNFVTKYRDAITFFSIVIGIVGLLGGCIWYAISPTVYDFGNDAQLIVPFGTFSVDQRKEGYGVVVESGTNVTVYNNSDQWRSLTVSYRKPGYRILDTHAFEDLPPKSSKTFGADYELYAGMHVSVSNYAQEKREKIAKKS